MLQDCLSLTDHEQQLRGTILLRRPEQRAAGLSRLGVELAIYQPSPNRHSGGLAESDERAQKQLPQESHIGGHDNMGYGLRAIQHPVYLRV